MRNSRVLAACGAAALVAAALAPVGAGSASAKVVHTGKQDSYLVLSKTAAGAQDVAARLRAQGATVTSVNQDVGMVAVRSDDANFRNTAGAVAGVQGVAADRVVGRTPARDTSKVERENLHAVKAGRAPAPRRAAAKATSNGDPLDNNLWGMRMIKADQAHTRTLGNRKVKVGIMDTGVQADHPDIHPNFDNRDSRNFTTDIVAIDGPCEAKNCIDPVGVDDDGHGTHTAGTIAAAMNGFGLSGVAPKATIVEVRAGQDSGYFFAGPTVNALTYSGDAGLDVVNMSFYVDPWLYNCRGGAPEDTPEQAQDQDVIIQTVNRALRYAHRKGVTLVAAAGNEHTDLANPGTDVGSPDYGDPAHPRTIDNDSCVDLPTEGPHVLGVTALGPSGRKSDFSSYTTEPRSGEIEFSAPGGWYRDGVGTPSFQTNGNLILSTYPLGPLQASGEVDANGNVTPLGQGTGVVKQCQATPAKGTSACAYYAWLQGTSMASPHAAGVAALAVGAHGHREGRGRNAGFGMAPNAVARLMTRTAIDHTCPAGGAQSYTDVGRDATWTAPCVGNARRNGLYGAGIVNAWGVVR
ncbi:MAG: peptidase and in kexin sedolisin [Marmoricola sp.]|nr:peptidase and in kexin sedolisin [Marmoricola sp.]